MSYDVATPIFICNTVSIGVFMVIRNIVLTAAALASLSILGCSDGKTKIIKKESVVVNSEHHEHKHEGDIGHGRLLVVHASTPEASIFDLEENTLLDTFSLSSSPSAVYASAGYRYGVLVDRMGDTLNFIDGGLWQEDHVDHLHGFEEAPSLLEYVLLGSRPTHIVPYNGQLAIFFDGDAATVEPAKTMVVSDVDIAAENLSLPSIDYDINMHGVAEPRGNRIFSTWRREDENTTSGNPILPDQVAVYELDEGSYSRQGILEENCPDLHGAAQNNSFVLFGCSDGVLLVKNPDENYVAEKIVNPDDLEQGLRVGSIYGHRESDQFIGLASAHGGDSSQWFNIDAQTGRMDLIDWLPVEGAAIVGRGFSFEAQQFLILDSQGYLTILDLIEYEGQAKWTFGARLNISEGEQVSFPEGSKYSLSFSQNSHQAFITNPVAQEILVINLDSITIERVIELDFIPKFVTWLGVAEDH